MLSYIIHTKLLIQTKVYYSVCLKSHGWYKCHYRQSNKIPAVLASKHHFCPKPTANSDYREGFVQPASFLSLGKHICQKTNKCWQFVMWKDSPAESERTEGWAEFMMEMATEPYGCKSDLLTVYAHRYLQMKGQSKEGLSASQESWICRRIPGLKTVWGHCWKKIGERSQFARNCFNLKRLFVSLSKTGFILSDDKSTTTVLRAHPSLIDATTLSSPM